MADASAAPSASVLYLRYVPGWSRRLAYSNHDTSRKTNARRRVHCTGRTRLPEVSDIRVVHLHCGRQSPCPCCFFIPTAVSGNPRLCFARGLSLPVRSRSHLQAHTRASSRWPPRTGCQLHTSSPPLPLRAILCGAETHPLASCRHLCLLNDTHFALFPLLPVVARHHPSALRG